MRNLINLIPLFVIHALLAWNCVSVIQRLHVSDICDRRILQIHAGVLLKNTAQNVRNLIEHESERRVVYAMDQDLDPSIQHCMEKSMKEISKHSCVQFVDEKRTNASVFLRFLSSESAGYIERLQYTRYESYMCFSECHASMSSFSINISLGSSCGTQDRQCMRIVLNSLGIGMENERFDRSQYIHINRSNVRSDAIPLFERVVPSENIQVITEYDISSIMHFTAQEYSKSPESPVITTNNRLLDPSLGGEIRGRHHPLSHRDKQTINRLFKCSALGKHDANTKCLHNGFMGEHGECICPHGFNGPRCEILSFSSRFNVPICGIMKERQGEILSPNYPHRYSRGAYCQWLVEGTDTGDRILFRINDLDLEHENMMPGDHCADKLTIWPHGTDVVTKSISCLPEETPMYKGKWYTSQYNWLLVEFRSDTWGQHNHMGFNISYKILDPPTSPPQFVGVSAGDQWKRKQGEKWKSAGNEKTANESHGTKARLLNTIARQGQLFCYACDNETHCGEYVLHRRSCPAGQACAYHITEHGLISWRGCISVDVCSEEWPPSDCYNENDPPDQECFQCCGSNLCNAAFADNQINSNIHLSGSNIMIALSIIASRLL